MAVTFEQAPTSVTADGSSTTIALAYGSNVKAGSVLWCNISFDISHDVITGVADNLNSSGGAWTLIVGSTQTGDGQRNELWYRANTIAGACTVTVTWGAAGATFRRLAVVEVSGVDPAPLDQKVAAIGSSNSPDSTAKTTTTDGQYIAGGIYTNTNAITVLNGFNSRMVTVKNVMVIDQTQTSQGSISVAVTIGGSENWNALMATFKAASGRRFLMGRH